MTWTSVWTFSLPSSAADHMTGGSRDQVETLRGKFWSWKIKKEGQTDGERHVDGRWFSLTETQFLWGYATPAAAVRGGCVWFVTRRRPLTLERFREEESLTGRKTLISWRFHASKHNTNLSLCHNASHQVIRKKNTERLNMESDVCQYDQIDPRQPLLFIRKLGSKKKKLS